MKNSEKAVLDALADDAHLTTEQLAAATGLNPHTVKRNTMLLHREPRQIYIWDWTRGSHGGRGDAVWAAGDDEDAECARGPADMSAVNSLREAWRTATDWNPFSPLMWQLGKGARG